MGMIGKQLASVALASTDISDGVITAAKIATDAVTADKIAANAVDTSELNANAVTAAKISGASAAAAGTFLKQDGTFGAAGVTYPTNSVAPSVSSTGTGNDTGDVITLAGGTWANASTYEYRWWMRNANGLSHRIYNSTTSYTRTADDSGYVINAEVRATGASGDRSKWIETSNRIGQFKKTFTDTGADQSFTIPSGVTSITIKAWGSVGGSEGGFATGTLSVTAGTDYKIVIGHNTADGYAGRRTASTAGGLTGMFTGTGAIDYESTTDQARAIIIAAGGAGAEGGGTNGGQGYTCTGCGGGWSATTGGFGGTQTAVGAVGQGSGGAVGVVMRGGHGAQGGPNDGSPGYFAGAGGGGRWDGEGGFCCWAGGGSGSGFIHSSLTSASLVTGANETDSDWVTGYGRTNEGGTGHGAMIIWY